MTNRKKRMIISIFVLFFIVISFAALFDALNNDRKRCQVIVDEKFYKVIDGNPFDEGKDIVVIIKCIRKNKQGDKYVLYEYLNGENKGTQESILIDDFIESFNL